MGTITLPNFRVSGTDRAHVRLKDGGVYVEWSRMTEIKAWLYSVEQKAISGRFDVRLDPQDGTRLLCVYSAQKPQYLGVNKIILQCKYEGAEKAYDKPLWNFVRWTADQDGEEITIDDPEVDVEIVAEDMSSSVLDEATAAALAAADKANEAAEQIPLQVLTEAREATQEAREATEEAEDAAEHATPYIGENGHWWRWDKASGAYVDTGETAKGPTGNGIQSVEQTQSSQESEGENVVTVTMTNGSQAQFSIRNGKQGERGLQGVPGVANAKYKQVDTLPTASADTMDFIYLTPTQTSGVYDMSYTEQDGNTYTWKPLGTTAIQLADYATEAEVSQLRQKLYGIEKTEVSLNTEAGKYIGDSGNIAGGGTTTDFVVRYISCSPGEKYVLTYPTNGPADGSAKCYAIYSVADINSASSRNVLERGTSTKDIVANTEVEINVTYESAKLLCITQYVSGIYNLTPTLKKVTAVNKFNKLDEELSAANSRIDGVDDRVVAVEEKTVINVDIEHIGELQDGYINTGDISIGDTVNTTPVASGGWAYLTLPVLSGQSFRVKGSGGNNPRLWALCDSDYKLLSRAPAQTITETYIDITADENGYLICNVDTVVDFNSVVSLIPEDIDLYVKELNEKVEVGKQETHKVEVNLSDNTFLSDSYIAGSGFVGTSDTFGCYAIPCKKGDVFSLYTFKALNSPIARSFAIYNSIDTFNSETVIEVGAVSADGKIEISVTDENAKTLLVGWRTVADITLFKEVYDSAFLVIDEKLYNEKHDSPKVHFDIGHELKTTNIREVFDLSDNIRPDYYGLTGITSLMFQIQDQMDLLVAANPEYITKTDAAVEAGLSYPEYANGIETAGTYLVTPRYRTYMYKLSYNNPGVNGKCNRPTKVLISGSVHGNEQTASLNLYTIMRELCNDYLSDVNIFRARGAFEFYIIPCVNGYCSIHRNRVNANGVNINRNFPTPDWAEQGSNDPTSQNYRGPSAGSEFETKLIMALINKIKPDIYIDAHNYSTSDTLQFYTEMTDIRNVRMAYDSIADVSYTLKKAFPQWFGTEYSMLKGDANTVSSGHAPADNDNSSAKGPVWAYLNGIPFAITIEISGGINYNGGVLNGHDAFAEQVYQIGEYTFMCQLYRYGQFVSNRLISPRYYDW